MPGDVNTNGGVQIGAQLPVRVTQEQIIESSQTKLALDKIHVNTFKKDDTTPNVANLLVFKASGSVVNIVDFIRGQEGQSITIRGDGTTTVVQGDKIKTNTGANKLLATDKIYRFTRIDGIWIEDE